MLLNTSIASNDDIPSLVKLINSAYRAMEGVIGWTYEGHLLEGARTDATYLEELISKPNSIILLCTKDDRKIIGSVHLEMMADVLYLGMLAVDPHVQNQGIGRYIINAAKQYGLRKNCTKIKITVISVRFELIAWYERCGFFKTGESVEFHAGERFGRQKQSLELITMEMILHVD